MFALNQFQKLRIVGIVTVIAGRDRVMSVSMEVLLSATKKIFF